jgi:hypothetical protein
VTQIQMLKEYIEEAFALELLQYHNSSYLKDGGNPKLLSEQMQRLLSASRAIALDLLKKEEGKG